MPIRHIDLTTQHARFISKEIKAGRYRDESEVMQAGLRLLQDAHKQEALKLKTLRSMVQQGLDELDEGMGIALHDNDELRKFIRKLGREAGKRSRSMANR